MVSYATFMSRVKTVNEFGIKGRKKGWLVSGIINYCFCTLRTMVIGMVFGFF